MSHVRTGAAWRPAALRGWSIGDGRGELLVALSGEQYLRIPVPPACLEAFRARLGRRVWVDLDTWHVCAELPIAARHA